MANINKSLSTTGLESYKWDLIRIDTSDLDTNTQRIGKIIHYIIEYTSITDILFK